AVINRELHELAQSAAKVHGLRSAMLAQDGRDFLPRLDEFPEFAARFRRFLEDHGHREMDMDYYQPTWSGQPGVVVDALRLLLRNEWEEDPAETARRQRQRYFETEHAFLAGVPESLRFFFRELIRLARTYTGLDDLEHYQTTRINPVARRTALAIGRRLQERGILDFEDDIFFLHKTDLEEMVAAYPNEDGPRYRRAAEQTKRAYQASWQQTPAWVLDESGRVEEAGASLRGL